MSRCRGDPRHLRHPLGQRVLQRSGPGRNGARLRARRRLVPKQEIGMKLLSIAMVLFLAPALASAEVWHFKKPFLEALVKQVPGILKTQDKKTGRFGEGVWMVN